MTDVPARSSGVRRGGDRPNSPCRRAATTRPARRSPRGCAGARSETPTERSCSGPAAGMRWRCGWRPTGPSGRQPAGRPRRSPRRDGGPPRSWPRWTGLPPRPRRRPAIHGSPASCCSPGLSSPGWKDGPTPERWQMGGRRLGAAGAPLRSRLRAFPGGRGAPGRRRVPQTSRDRAPGSAPDDGHPRGETAAARDRVTCPARPPPPPRTDRRGYGT